eukprot:CAMPEP_0119468550 /NCGR_PEP_ID=MMETSP1344-20130328/2257_1 /TAXON_ID=236787 /ORGANISM="Florenciella parvula, Strain CCMP2471" /LENGTH=198 /DNA_ID=CAMNT_0007501031 /DNA_START=182 /DNA_END=775 /DNA_ORIENTATION=+
MSPKADDIVFCDLIKDWSKKPKIDKALPRAPTVEPKGPDPKEEYWARFRKIKDRKKNTTAEGTSEEEGISPKEKHIRAKREKRAEAKAKTQAATKAAATKAAERAAAEKKGEEAKKVKEAKAEEAEKVENAKKAEEAKTEEAEKAENVPTDPQPAAELVLAPETEFDPEKEPKLESGFECEPELVELAAQKPKLAPKP